MNCFIGLSVISPIRSSTTFSNVLTQIKHFLNIQSNIKIIPNSNLLIISHHHQKFYIPKNPAFMHTNFQHIILSDKHDQQFVEAILQCLQIIKENFPSKIQIQIQTENVEIREKKRKGEEEISRRLIAQLKILQEETRKRELQRIQLQDLLYVLSKQFHKDYDHKLKLSAIRILNEGIIQPRLWMQLSEQQVRIIDNLAQKQQYQKQSIQILQKIIRHKKQWQVELSGQKQNINHHNYQVFAKKQTRIVSVEPKEIKSILFQLRESINLGRIVYLVQNIDLNSLNQKQLKKLDSSIESIGSKFLQSFYQNFEHSLGFAKVFEKFWKKRGVTFYKQMIEEVYEKAESEGKFSSNIEFVSDFEH